MRADAAIFQGDPFWDPVTWSWPVIGILLAGTVLATIALIVWLVLQPEEPDHDTKDLVDEAVRRDRDTAGTIRRRLDADAGRADTSEPDLR